MELEAEKRDLVRLITMAEADAEHLLTEAEIITTLRMFQNGDINDKDYQEAMIDTFLVAAYIYDDHIKYIFNLGGDKKSTEIPLEIDNLNLQEVRISDGVADQNKKVHPLGGLSYLDGLKDSKGRHQSADWYKEVSGGHFFSPWENPIICGCIPEGYRHILYLLYFTTPEFHSDTPQCSAP